MKTLLSGLSHIATFDAEDRELADADILIDGATIAAIGPSLDREGVDRVIDGTGLVALPGLINAHHHLYQAHLRALPQLERSGLPEMLAVHSALGLDRWHAGRFGAQEVGAIARAVLTESALSGVTTVADQHLFFPGDRPEPYVEAVITAASEVGIRLHACRGTTTLGRSSGGPGDDILVMDIDDVLRHAEELIDKHHDPAPLAMVRIALAPGGIVADRLEIFDRFAALADRHEAVRLHTHLYMKGEDEFSRRLHGKSPWQVLQEHGFANGKFWAAHAALAPLSEIAEFAEAGIAIAHVPACDIKLGWGLAPVREFLETGIPVGFATTGSATNDGSNLLADLRLAFMAHRLKWPDDPQKWFSARELFRMATSGSAACLGRPDLGSLAVGKAADISCWDMTGVDRVGIHDPVAGLLSTGISSVAELVLVNGRPVVENSRSVQVDATEVANAAHAALKYED